MAHLRFRVLNVYLDDEEDVKAIDAVVRDDTTRVIHDLVGDAGAEELGAPRRGGTEFVLRLTRSQIYDLFDKVGKTTGEHPDHEHTHEIYDSLSFVVYRMMEDD